MPLDIGQRIWDIASRYGIEEVDSIHVYYDEVYEEWYVSAMTPDGPIDVRGYDKKSDAREEAYEAADSLSDEARRIVIVRVWKMDDNLETERTFEPSR